MDVEHISMAEVCPGFSNLRRLGKGGFGVVYLAKRRSDQLGSVYEHARCRRRRTQPSE